MLTQKELEEHYRDSPAREAQDAREIWDNLIACPRPACRFSNPVERFMHGWVYASTP